MAAQQFALPDEGVACMLELICSSCLYQLSSNMVLLLNGQPSKNEGEHCEN